MEGEIKKGQEQSFEEQMLLAKALYDAVDARNDFTERLGGFEDFAAVHQYVDGNREKYDKLEDACNEVRKKFDETVTDKKPFVEHLRNIGETKLADRITRMFRVR